MNLMLSILLFLIVQHDVLGQSTTEYLRFRRVNTTQKEDLVYVTNDQARTVNLDASHRSQVLIKISDHLVDSPPMINFACMVHPLTTALSKAEFCWTLRFDMTEDCKPIGSLSTVTYGAQSMTFKVTQYKDKEGFSVQSQWLPLFGKDRKMNVEGYFYCRLSNAKGTLQSNYIEVQDLLYYKYEILRSMSIKSNQMNEIKPIVNNDFPLSFHCGEGSLPKLPTWAEREMLSPFMWGICPAALNDGTQATTATCYNSNTAGPGAPNRGTAISELGEVSVLVNGTLLFFAPKIGSFPTNFAIGCYSPYVPQTSMTTYCQKANIQAGNDPVIMQGITYDTSQPYTLNKIVPISNTDNTYELRAGKMGFTFVLTAVYKANPSSSKSDIDFSWTKDGEENLPVGFPLKSSRDRFTLEFPTSISTSYSGLYKLTLKQYTPAQDTVVFTFRVTVLSPPSVRDPTCMPALLYRMTGETATISCAYDNIATADVYINGVLVRLSGAADIQNQVRALAQTYRNLANLKVSITPPQMDPSYLSGGNPLVYSVSDLMFSDVMTEGQSHTVTFRAGNTVGYSASSSVIQVLKTPVFTERLLTYDCTTNCRAVDKHEFRCVLDPVLDAQYRQQGVTPIKRWLLGGMTLDEQTGGIYGEYFVFNSTDVLLLLPVKTSNQENDRKMQEALKDNKLVCQLQILHPDYLKYASTEWDARGIIVYDSTKDNATAVNLVAGIRLQFKPIAQASFMWIIAVVLAVVIIIIVVVLSVCFCSRDRGEVYKVDAKEREQGNDPVQEIKEKEVFKTYERQEGDPGEAEHGEEDHLKGSRHSLTEASVDVGSDEDGELDDYGIDPGKFNEEGSFIGQYANTPTKKSLGAADSQV